MKHTVLVNRTEDGSYRAHVPSLPGCSSNGATLDEALKNIKTAITAYEDARRASFEKLSREHHP